MGREAARMLWPLVLQLWGQHPLVLLIIAAIVAVGVALGLSSLWDFYKPPQWQPHEAYRPPAPDDADRRSTPPASQGNRPASTARDAT
jgi:hypothetical protein